MSSSARNFIFAMLAACFGAGAACSQDAQTPAHLAVDLRDAPRHIYHAKLLLPVKPGPLTLVYPKWIQGEHAPTGPIANLAGLKMSAAGKEISWQRDDVDMFAFHLDVPKGAETLEVSLDYLSPAEISGSREEPSATAQIALLNWYVLTLYPQGPETNDLTFVASLRLPSGWKYGTALPVAKETPDGIEFLPASLTTLIDSPVLAGAHFRNIDLTPGQKPEHSLHIAADGTAALEPSSAEVQHLRQLVAESGALFGARHYRRYDFLLALTDHMPPDGVEHHESSANTSPEALFLDPDVREMHMDLLPHEFTHSWNGKYRRPAGLIADNYQSALKGDLLWVYEGMTQYYGVILAARSGFWTPDRFREYLASCAAVLEDRVGRTWRNLQDTAVSSQILYGQPDAGTAWRRSVDYYEESMLIWLEADTILRRETNGGKSLDDFARKFAGGESSGPKVVSYTFDDIVSGMNDVAPYDWRGFFTERLNSHGPGAPLGGLQGGGWKLVYTDAINEHQRSEEIATVETDVEFSLGFKVHLPSGEDSDRILDVTPGSPAAKAGLSYGMRLVAVNGRKWTPDGLRDAIHKAKNSKDPIELLVENEDYFQTYPVDYHGGERYPHLQAIGGKPDVLSEIAARKAAPVPAPNVY